MHGSANTANFISFSFIPMHMLTCVPSSRLLLRTFHSSFAIHSQNSAVDAKKFPF